MLYEIVNPSDYYTLVADSIVPAAVAVAILGNGHYGLRTVAEGKLATPVIFGWDEWLKEHGVSDLDAYLTANAHVVADILDTVLIGDRAEVEAKLPLLPEAEREKWLAQRHGFFRSSMNDIGARAKSLAVRLRNLRVLKDVA